MTNIGAGIKSPARLDSLDAARATMLLLGIPLHVCEAYRISGGFKIDSPDVSFTASMISGLVHCFRMPAFFLLSGYFALMIMDRSGAWKWLKGRYWKLGVPLLLTGVTLGLLEYAIVIHFRDGLGIQESILSSAKYPAEWIDHRWFLIILLLFCTVLAALPDTGATIRKLWIKVEPQKTLRSLLKAVYIISLLLLPFASIVAGKFAGEWFIESDFLKFYAISFIKYGAFFVLGVVLYATPNGIARFATFTLFDICAGILAVSIYIVTYFGFYTDSAGQALYSIRIGIESIAGFYAAKAFYLAMLFSFKKRNRTVTYFVDASFCIYLVHAVFYLLFCALMLGVSWPPLIEIMIAVSATIAASVVTYEGARRSHWLALALNGGPFKRQIQARRSPSAGSGRG